MEKFTLTVPNKLYGDRECTSYKFNMTVGKFTFEAAVYKNGPKSWRVCLASNAARIDEGSTRKEAIENAQKRCDSVGEDRIKWSVEQHQ